MESRGWIINHILIFKKNVKCHKNIDLPEEKPKDKFEKEIPENKNEDKENDEHESDKEKKEKPRKKSIDIDANKENKDSTRANVAVTTEGYSLSRIIPGDPINSILGIIFLVAQPLYNYDICINHQL